MKSEFCQWLTDLQIIGTTHGIIIEAQHYDVLEYLFRTGHSVSAAYPNYIEVKQRLEAIEKSDEIINQFKK